LRASSALAVLALLAAAPAAWASSPPIDPSEIVAAERAFAADGLALGIRQSFLKHSAPEAIVFQPGPVKVQDAFAKAPDDAKGPPLAWWPLWAGISNSGDLGFTTGPFTYGGKPAGYYFTVWAKQADGTWKWIFDGGAPGDSSQAAGPDTPIIALPPGDTNFVLDDEASTNVRVAEDALAERSATDSAAAYKDFLAPYARVQGSRLPPATTPEAVAKELATRPKSIHFSSLGGQASKAGDLVWTFGDAEWNGGHGHYVRIWQRRDGWRIVFDELLPITTP
jgi:ketosteroid isomerase-like protein